MGAKIVKALSPDHVYKGTYTFRFKRRKTLSSLVKPEPPYETLVDALTELGRTSKLLKVKHKGDTLEATLKVVAAWYQDDYRAALLRRSASGRGPTTLPVEIVNLIMDFIGAALSREAVARAKKLAFDDAHLSTRARALQGMEEEEFAVALEEWLVDEGFVYTPPPPLRSVEPEDGGEGVDG
ncbi:uncharacterized protein LOC62_04G005457 [Vanrija pseudolonga]|uniref:Uncharacterized protein n=1 Tax=Vanrija pseudolonga TaxID=143232 RepID=A0AAF1BL98_9TREE|nr:hypothetical protein LOC62_04G005457 [Vanrija pseudolonga]